MRTRHATDPPAVPMVERDAEGGGGGDLTDGPLDGQTNRESNPRPRRAPAMAHTTRPSMPLTKMALVSFWRGGGALLNSPVHSKRFLHRHKSWVKTPSPFTRSENKLGHSSRSCAT